MDDRAWTQSTRALLDELRESDQESGVQEVAGGPERAAAMLRRATSPNLYEVLGVARTADSATIKAAYFEQVALYHPDRVKPEELGLRTDQQRQIISSLTSAYDTLKRRRTREPYDLYLKNRTSTLGARTSTAPAARSGEEERAATTYSVVQPAPRRSTKPTVRAVAAVAKESPHPRPSRRPVARSVAPRPRAPTSIPPDVPPGSIPPQSRVTGIPIARVGRNRFRVLMDGAIAEENWASAVNLARLALEVEPDDAGLQNKLQELLAKADRALAGKFLAQAKYEEQSRDYARAARSYERAANGKASAELYAKAARCMLAAAVDNRRAVEVARKAMLLEQESAEYRVVLARAYIAVGMHQSALGEARRALVYEPKNTDAKTIVKELKKGTL